MDSYEERAFKYAKHYGITDWEIKGNKMIYFETEYSSKNQPETVYIATVNLDNFNEVRTPTRYTSSLVAMQNYRKGIK